MVAGPIPSLDYGNATENSEKVAVTLFRLRCLHLIPFLFVQRILSRSHGRPGCHIVRNGSSRRNVRRAAQGLVWFLHGAPGTYTSVSPALGQTM